MPDNVWKTPLGQATLSRAREDAENREREALARKKQQRMYAAARASRLTTGFSSSQTSANAELHSSLRALRNRSHQLVRDSAYAKRAKKIVINNVIGTGIGMQPGVKGTRGDVRKAVNAAISDAFWRWCDPNSCHTGGQLHFSDLERQLMGQVFESGEILVRMHARAFGNSQVPLALEIVEPERLADDLTAPGDRPGVGKFVDGIEVDGFYRPIAYLLKTVHPGEHLFAVHEISRIERVPADQMIHLRIIDRWPQVRGEPWMHAVIRKLADMDGYTEAEIVAARAAAMYFGTVESPEGADSFGEEQADGTFHLPLEPGMVEKLAPGEKLNFVNPNRPNSALDPFMRYMVREFAVGTNVTYESVSGDYSQSNYSSSRMGLLDDRDNWRAIQQWFIRNFRERLHRLWLQQAVLAGAIDGVTIGEYANDRAKFEAVAFKPRGWSWVDPTKEVAAYKEAVKAGFTTVTDVIAQTDPQGRDAEEVFELRDRELDEMETLGLVFDTSPEAYAKPDPATPAAPAEPAVADDAYDNVGNEQTARELRVVHLRK